MEYKGFEISKVIHNGDVKKKSNWYYVAEPIVISRMNSKIKETILMNKSLKGIKKDIDTNFK